MDENTPNQKNPAANLASDLLMTIFEFHNMMPHNPDISRFRAATLISWDALLRLRYISQTCSAWRSLTLNSPLLWARAIYLNSFCPRNRNKSVTKTNDRNTDANPTANEEENWTLWMKEVIRRTQTSPLWVVGFLDRPELTQTAVNLIKKEWHRIERIMIELDRFQVYPELEDIITKQAPLLQRCCFQFNSNQITAAPPSYIFANHAPFLTTLSLRTVWIDHKATFLSGLQSLSLEFQAISLSEIVKILRKTPLLSFLQIGSVSGNEHMDGELPYLHLPHLNHIRYTGLIPLASALLEHIIPSPGCSLSLNFWRNSHNEPTSEQVDPLIIFAKRFLKHHTPRRMKLNITSFIRFNIVLTSGTKRGGPEFLFDYYDFSGENIPMDSIISLVRAFSVPELACIKEFRLETPGDSETAEEAIIKTFAPLLLRGLEVFIVEQNLLAAVFEPYLDQSSAVIADIFPRLRTIVIKGLGSHDIQGSETLKGVLSRLLYKVY